MRATLLLLAAALPLAACTKEGSSTTVTFNSGDGNTVASADGTTGDVKLDLPGFAGKITLPKIQLDAENFDLNGVHLYPGSTIQSFNVAAGEEKGGHKGNVRIAFTSPASAEAVRDWLMQRLNKADFTVSSQGSGLVGTTDEKKPFRLDLTPAGSDKASGVITVGT